MSQLVGPSPARRHIFQRIDHTGGPIDFILLEWGGHGIWTPYITRISYYQFQTVLSQHTGKDHVSTFRTKSINLWQNSKGLIAFGNEMGYVGLGQGYRNIDSWWQSGTKCTISYVRTTVANVIDIIEYNARIEAMPSPAPTPTPTPIPTPSIEPSEKDMGCSCDEINKKLTNQTIELRETMKNERILIRNDTKQIIELLKGNSETTDELKKLQQQQAEMIHLLQEIDGEKIRKIQNDIDYLKQHQGQNENINQISEQIKELQNNMNNNLNGIKQLQDQTKQIDNKIDQQRNQDLKTIEERINQLKINTDGLDTSSLKDLLQRIETQLGALSGQ